MPGQNIFQIVKKVLNFNGKIHIAIIDLVGQFRFQSSAHDFKWGNVMEYLSGPGNMEDRGKTVTGGSWTIL